MGPFTRAPPSPARGRPALKLKCLGGLSSHPGSCLHSQPGVLMSWADNSSVPLSLQSQIFAEQIKVNQAAGSSLEKAVQDVRMTFERLLGPDPDREADINAAHQHIREVAPEIRTVG